MHGAVTNVSTVLPIAQCCRGCRWLRYLGLVMVQSMLIYVLVNHVLRTRQTQHALKEMLKALHETSHESEAFQRAMKRAQQAEEARALNGEEARAERELAEWSLGPQDTKKVLYITSWGPSPRGVLQWLPMGDRAFRNCPNLPKSMKCSYTKKPSDFAFSHAVLLDGASLKTNYLPSIRIYKQKWIFYSNKAPTTVWDNVNLNSFREAFNITATYIADSDIRLRTHIMRCIRRPGWVAPHRDLSAAKTHQAVMISDRCRTHSHREDYVDLLRAQNISVDVLGLCGQLRCGASRLRDKWACIENQLVEKYRFLLVFEESLCQDYISELLAATWNLNIIPVVLGMADYANFLPPGSYIDVRDHSNPARLSVLLNSITEQPQLYNTYMDNKLSHDCHVAKSADFPCDLCRYLHDHKDMRQTVTNIGSYWGIHQRCQAPSVFYHGVADALMRNQDHRMQLDGIHEALLARSRQKPVQVVTMTMSDHEPPRMLHPDKPQRVEAGFVETHLMVHRAPNGSSIQAQPHGNTNILTQKQDRNKQGRKGI